jgi:hypothetical protein
VSTSIYQDREAFRNRTDKDENGVSADFAKSNPDYAQQNATNKACWNCSYCSGCIDCIGCSDCSYCSGCSDCSGCSCCIGCSDCSDCSGCSGCSDCSDCSDCSGCSDCSDCSDCSGCSDCSDCSGCSGCSGCSEKNGKKEAAGESWFSVPKIPNIHQTVLRAVEKPDALKMSDWHTCNTTHCRGGWVVVLAGEPGRKLEAASSTIFAAMQIYRASSPIRVSPVRFFEKNEVAMADIKRCAEEEIAAQTKEVGA